MTKLDRLIAELCPNGVEYKKLGEIGEFVRGSGLQKKDFRENGVGCIHYGQIYTYYGIFADKTKSFVSPQLAKTLKKVQPGDLIIASTSENVEDVCKTVAWLGTDEIVTGGHSTIFKHNQNPKYLAYYFTSQKFFDAKCKYARGTKVIDISAKNLAKIRVPVPPLPIQVEIVRILDKFAEFEVELEVQLAAELTARKKHYEYYKNTILTLGKESVIMNRTADSRQQTADSRQQTADSRRIVRWTTLGEVTMYSKMRIEASKLDGDNYIGVDNLLQDKMGKTLSSYVPSKGNFTRFDIGDILIGNIRPYLKKIWKATTVGGTNGDVLVISVNDKECLSPDYLYYLLSSDEFFNYDMQYAKGAKMPRGNKQAVMNYSIPIPPLDEQERIVSILDRFDALTNDITSGLPAEIAARRKQYEYYRDKLLRFPQNGMNPHNITIDGGTID